MLSQSKHNILFACLCVAGIVIGLFTVYMLSQVILLTLVAVLLAVGLIGLVEWCSRKTNLSYTLAFALLVTLVVVLIGVAGWLFGDWVGQASMSITDQTKGLSTTAIQAINQIPGLSAIPPNELVAEMAGFVESGGIFSQVASGIEAVATVLTQFTLLILVALYIAFSPQQYKRGLLYLTPSAYQAMVATSLTTAYRTILKWFAARGLSMTVVGVLTYIGLLLLGIPYAAPLAILAFALSFIPNLGPVLSFVPAALVGLSIGVQSLLFVIILYSLVQAAESNFITPMIEKKTVSTPPALLLMSQLAGGVLFGLMGLLLAAPVVAVLIALWQERHQQLDAD